MTDLDRLQARVRAWVICAFGLSVFRDRRERALRVAEEALEYLQAEGVPRIQAMDLIIRVYDRPAGDPDQELAGIGVTLLAAAAARAVRLDHLITTELDRVERPEVVERCRAKQNEKEAAGVGRRAEA